MSMMLYVLIFLAVFLAIEGFAMLLSERRTGGRATARRRLRQIATGIQDPDVTPEGSILRKTRDAGRSLLDLQRLIPAAYQLERRLYQAGMTISPARFLLLCAGLGVGAWLLASVMLSQPSLALPFLAVGLLPFWHVSRQRAKRMRKFEEQFPEALDLLTRALRAGHALTFGFQMVGDEMPDPLGSEFAQVAEELKLGQDLRVALGNMVYRAEAGDLPFFITAITIQRETGGNLAEVLEKLGTLIRDRFALYGKVRALTAIGRASANLLVCMPLVLVASLFTCGGAGGRAYIEPLYTSTAGLMLSGVALSFVIIGYIICRRMARIEV